MVMHSYCEWYQILKKQLASAFEADQLFAFITDKTPPPLPDTLLPQEQAQQISVLLERRLAGEPLQYLLGEWEFYGLPFSVGPGVLIPRPDTETLVDLALEKLQGLPQAQVLDLCSGSGCVAIAIAQHSHAAVTALEYFSDAFRYLQQNITRNQSSVLPVQGDLFIWQPAQTFDLITCNPPYIPAADIANLQIEVQHEPRTALDGGADGLNYYRFITQYYQEYLKPKGWLLFEIGIGQEQDVAELFLQNGYRNVEIRRDLAGLSRVVGGERTME